MVGDNRDDLTDLYEMRLQLIFLTISGRSEKLSQATNCRCQISWSSQKISPALAQYIAKSFCYGLFMSTTLTAISSAYAALFRIHNVKARWRAHYLWFDWDIYADCGF